MNGSHSRTTPRAYARRSGSEKQSNPSSSQTASRSRWIGTPKSIKTASDAQANTAGMRTVRRSKRTNLAAPGRLPGDRNSALTGGENHSRPNRVVGGLIDEDEATRGAVAGIGIDDQRRAAAQAHPPDLVQLELCRGLLTQRVDV